MSVKVSSVKVKAANGEIQSLGSYEGKVLLIVNVASHCGFTKQYSGLQKLQNEYGSQGLQVLGFPCNDFGNQEPGTLQEIQQFCSTTYAANFPLFEKVHAKGNTTEPYTTLNKAEPSGDVEWNFEKFLVNREGTVIGRFKSAIEPNDVELKSAIENVLKTT